MSKDDDVQPSTRLDPRAEPPEQPPTRELPKVPEWAIELTKSVKSGIAEVRADISLVSNDLGILKQRVSIIEGLRVEDEHRLLKLSGGVRGLSGTDLQHEAELAQERAAREAGDKAREVLTVKVDALAATNQAQLDILKQLARVASNPLAKTLAAMLATALVTWLASHGVHVQ